jgi:UDP-N-acetylmuramoyl-tripeptide--D-alanyl-D-alanine ligase
MLNINELVLATKGKLVNGDLNIIPQEYAIDSREIKEADFFVPVIGEKTDGHKYIIDCVKKGIIGFFISSNYLKKDEVAKESIKINKEICIVEVEDTSLALYEAAKFNRIKHIDIPVVAVTGSVGKTSTREMIASVLSEENTLLVTKKNYNSFIGLPIMVLKMDKQDICVLEVGIDKLYEMEALSDLLKPDICVITMIGTAHIGVLGSKDNIFSEKLKITNNIKGISTLIINSDDDYLKQIENSSKYLIEKFSIKDVGNVIYEDASINFETNIYNESKKIVINEIGKHNIYNALCAIKVAQSFKIKTDNILRGIAKYRNFSKRLEKKIIGENILIIDDTYNASIDSMISGLEAVNKIKGKRKIAVLGDMLELGEYSKKLHEEVGESFKSLNYDKLYTLGKEAKNISETAKKYMNFENVIHFEDKEVLIKYLKDNLVCNDIIYFKASNGMRFFDIIEELENIFNK